MTGPKPPQPRILICDELDPAAMEVFRRRGLEPAVRAGLNEDALVAAVGDVEALVVRSATRITRRVIEAAPRLRVVGRAGIGVDNIDCEAATERGVVVMNTPRGNATTTAELAIALLLALARHIPRADRMVRGGFWKKKPFVGTEITGKTLGVVGLGRIGRIVAERGRGLGMKVIAHDPYLDLAVAGPPVAAVEMTGLDDLLARADFVTLHVPLTDATRHLISWERLQNVKRGARLINAARGGIVDEEALLDALADGRLAGVALDVLAQEPPPPDHPFLRRDDVILTPHLGASSEEAQLRVAVDVAEQVSAFLLDGVAQNAVNAPTLAAEDASELAPFLLLAEKMGSFAVQRLGGPPRKIELAVGGDVARLAAEHLRLALLVGVLRHVLATGVNFVNAPTLARERGVLVLESVREDADYGHGQIDIRATERAGGRAIELVGTVFGREPRLVRVDGVRLDLPPRGPLLVTRHLDRPGVLGELGTLLGRHAVNIMRLEVAPPPPGEELAYGFLTLYGEPGPEVLSAVAGVAAIKDVQLVRL
ncbi:MAG: phosphoglycerate dehydrogenase [Planctomycetota bacterium]